jgi:hypothetical protein
MKLNIDCEHYKVIKKDSKTVDRCACKFLNRNFNRELKYYKTFMKSLEKKGK